MAQVLEPCRWETWVEFQASESSLVCAMMLHTLLGGRGCEPMSTRSLACLFTLCVYVNIPFQKKERKFKTCLEANIQNR